jgi:hypothetical protein
MDNQLKPAQEVQDGDHCCNVLAGLCLGQDPVPKNGLLLLAGPQRFTQGDWLDHVSGLGEGPTEAGVGPSV